MVKRRFCKRCGTQVRRETVKELRKEYPFYCPCCNENMYTFETFKKKPQRRCRQMSRCFFCGEAENRRPNVLIKVRGYKDGIRVQKNIRACEYCLSWRNKEDIKDSVGAYEDWD